MRTVDLLDRVAVVTGAGSGLGRATALALGAAGARVAVLDRDWAAAKATADECAGATPIEVDVADEGSVTAAVDRVTDVFGTVHVCVNAAGVAPASKVLGRHGPLPRSAFRDIVEINLVGSFDVLRQCAVRMVGNEPGPDGERGVVINVSSGAAWQGQTGQAAYAASKAGVIGMMLPLARELAEHAIRVVTIAPGIFDTGISAGFPESVRSALEDAVLHPSRFGDPREFAQLVEAILTNRYLNATTVSLDGGARMA